MKRLTEYAHEQLRTVLKPGDICIDATAGNGHDTLFLAKIVGPTGHVFAFDIQNVAIEATRRIAPEHVTLIRSSHAEMQASTPRQHHGNIAAIMFNLGYLPGSIKTIVTNPETTIPALAAAVELLKPNGMLTVMAYRGHDGGEAELECVRNFFSNKTAVQFDADSPSGPSLFILQKVVPKIS